MPQKSRSNARFPPLVPCPFSAHRSSPASGVPGCSVQAASRLSWRQALRSRSGAAVPPGTRAECQNRHVVFSRCQRDIINAPIPHIPAQTRRQSSARRSSPGAEPARPVSHILSPRLRLARHLLSAVALPGLSPPSVRPRHLRPFWCLRPSFAL